MTQAAEFTPEAVTRVLAGAGFTAREDQQAGFTVTISPRRPSDIMVRYEAGPLAGLMTSGDAVWGAAKDYASKYYGTLDVAGYEVYRHAGGEVVVAGVKR